MHVSSVRKAKQINVTRLYILPPREDERQEIELSLHLSNRALFGVYIASSKHEKGLEYSRQLCKPEDVVEGLHNFREFSQPPSA